MILNGIKFFGVVLIVSFVAYDFGFFESKVNTEQYCQENFSKSGDIMQYRIDNNIKEEALNKAKENYNFDSKDKYGEAVLESLVDSAYKYDKPFSMTDKRKLVENYSKKTYEKCLMEFENLGVENDDGLPGGVFNKMTEGIRAVS